MPIEEKGELIINYLKFDKILIDKSREMALARIVMCDFYNIYLVILLVLVNSVYSVYFDHAVDMDEDYRLLWSIKDQEITFEIQARTLGYIGLGFSRDGTIYGADIVTGWVSQGQSHFQVGLSDTH